MALALQYFKKRKSPSGGWVDLATVQNSLGPYDFKFRVSSGGSFVHETGEVWVSVLIGGDNVIYYGDLYTNSSCTQPLSGYTYSSVWAKVVVPTNFSEGFEVNSISFNFSWYTTSLLSNQVFSCDITPPIHTTGDISVSSVSGGSIPNGTWTVKNDPIISAMLQDATTSPKGVSMIVCRGEDATLPDEDEVSNNGGAYIEASYLFGENYGCTWNYSTDGPLPSG